MLTENEKVKEANRDEKQKCCQREIEIRKRLVQIVFVTRSRGAVAPAPASADPPPHLTSPHLILIPDLRDRCCTFYSTRYPDPETA